VSGARGPHELVADELRDVELSARRLLEASVLAWHPAPVAADAQRRRRRTLTRARAGS
jgi:hypothetical protein